VFTHSRREEPHVFHHCIVVVETTWQLAVGGSWGWRTLCCNVVATTYSCRYRDIDGTDIDSLAIPERLQDDSNDKRKLFT
jgi:hypothetical protein